MKIKILLFIATFSAVADRALPSGAIFAASSTDGNWRAAPFYPCTVRHCGDPGLPTPYIPPPFDPCAVRHCGDPGLPTPHIPPPFGPCTVRHCGDPGLPTPHIPPPLDLPRSPGAVYFR
jgi:hypothetical protein